MTVDDEACAQAGRAQDPWRAIYEASPVPMAIARRADDRILFVNRACLQLLGWTQAAVAGRTMVDVGFWTASEQRTRMLEQLDAGQPVHELEQTVTTGAGKALVVLMSIAFAELDGERCIVGHIHDITEARRLDGQLRESEARFRQLTETCDRASCCASFNRRRCCTPAPRCRTSSDWTATACSTTQAAWRS